MTGWGQAGPLAKAAGHDINYISLSGALHAIGGAETPVPPLNLLGDFGGGRDLPCLRNGLRDVRGATFGAGAGGGFRDHRRYGASDGDDPVDGGGWPLGDRRAANLLDGGAPFYGVYRCACGGFIAVGALEPQFYAELLRLMGLDGASAAGPR